MDVEDARDLAAKLNQVARFVVWHPRSRPENPNDWGVATNDGFFYGSVAELPLIAQAALEHGHPTDPEEYE